jgi:hypothetical protein
MSHYVRALCSDMSMHSLKLLHSFPNWGGVTSAFFGWASLNKKPGPKLTIAQEAKTCPIWSPWSAAKGLTGWDLRRWSHHSIDLFRPRAAECGKSIYFRTVGGKKNNVRVFVQFHVIVYVHRAGGQCYDRYFRRCGPIFGGKNGEFVKKQWYDYIFRFIICIPRPKKLMLL